MKLAVVFSGQGAQKPGMGKDLYDNNETARSIFDSIDAEVLNDCFTADETKLSLTSVTQPCIYAVSMAGYSALNVELAKLGKEVDGFAGFSLGEYSALTAGGILNFDQCYPLVKLRGRRMQAANDNLDSVGAMAAIIGLDDSRTELIDKIKSNINKNIWEVNFNCPKQVVVAGDEQCIDYAVEEGSQHGLKVIKLAVSGAFHSPYMQPVSVELAKKLNSMEVCVPLKSVYSNVTAKPFNNNLVDLISKQVCSPVLWQQTILNMIDDGFDTFVEVGVGNTLCGLIRKIDKTVKTHAVYDFESLNKTVLAITAS